MTRLTGDDSMLWIKGMLKKAASGVLALLPCSRRCVGGIVLALYGLGALDG